MVQLHRAMIMKSKTTKGIQAIGWMIDLPIITTMEPLLDVGFIVGRGF